MIEGIGIAMVCAGVIYSLWKVVKSSSLTSMKFFVKQKLATSESLPTKSYQQINRTSDMICRTKEIEIPEKYPFLNCKLNREVYASILTKVVGQLNEGGVLSICGEWGTGKTTFVKMWEQQLKNEKFRTLYFNVWEQDFISDPLIGIIAQFRQLVPEEGARQSLAKISKSFISIVAGMAPKIFKEAVKNKLGEEAAEIIEAGAENAAGAFKDILDEFENQSNSINEFKNCLASYVDYVSRNKPIVFIVDELDRCNPHYAVKTLERIKHLFNIPGIIFVLSIDKSQLCNSIRGYFGSEKLNAEEYLKRFIDFEYDLPKPDLNLYCQNLYNQFGFDQFFCNEERNKYFNSDEQSSLFMKTAETLFSTMSLNLRQIEKQFVHLRIALLSFSKNYWVHPGVIVVLEYIRHQHHDIYKKIYNREYNIDEFVAVLEECLPHNVISYEDEYDKDSYRFLQEVAKLICCYAQDDLGRTKTFNLLTEGNNPELTFKCKVFNEETLLLIIKHYINYSHSNGLFDLRLLIDHLELLKDFIVNK